MEGLSNVQAAKAAIAKIERENVNVHQFFPKLEHSFQKPSTTEATNFWQGLVSSVAGKGKKGKIVPPTAETVTTKATTSKDKYHFQTMSIEETRDTFDDLRIFSPDSDLDDFVIPTPLVKALQHNFENEGYFETIEDAKKCKRSTNIMRCQSLLDPFVWVSYKAELEPTPSEELSFSVQNTSFALIAKAKHDEQNGDYVGSLRKHNKIIALNPNDPFWMSDRAEVSLCLGDLQSAIYDYSRAYHLFLSSFVFKFRLAKLYGFQGQVYLDLKMYQDALDAFSKAATLMPDQIIYKAKCCSCLVNLKYFDQAWMILNKLLSQEPDNTDLILMRARLYHIVGEYHSSYQDLQTVLCQGEHPVASTMMQQVINKAEDLRHEAVKLNIQKQFFPAIKTITLAINLYAGEAKFYLLRGILHRHVEDFNSSIDDLVKSLNVCSRSQKEIIQKKAQHQLLLTFNDFSLECFSKGFHDEAIQLLNKAISGEKNEKSLYLNRAECFYQKMDFNFALQDYQQALELDPNDSSILPKIASVYYAIGMEKYINRFYEEALKTLTSAIEYAPTRGQYYITRCKCYQMLQKLNCARSDLMIAMQLVPPDKEIVPLLVYLFPNTSIADIMIHPMAIQAKYVVENLLGTNTSEHTVQPLSNDQSDLNQENSLEYLSITGYKRAPSTDIQLPTLTNNSNLTSNLVLQKKQINNKIQKALKNSKRLRPSNPDLTFKLRETNLMIEGRPHIFSSKKYIEQKN